MILKKIGIKSFSMTFALYSLYSSVLYAILDLIYKLIYGISTLTQAVGWGSWVLYIIGFLILSPILGFIFGAIISWIINLALKTSKGIKLDFE